MKKAMLILGIIGSLIALIGSFVTVIGGFGGTAVGVAGNSNDTAYSGAFVIWSGVLAIIVSAVSLVFSIVGGTSKSKNNILTFAIGVTISGILSVYLYNWFSGTLIAIAGILGLAGSKRGDGQARPLKSAGFYAAIVPTLLLVAISTTVKNGKTLVAEETPPFQGKKGFNFYGGIGTSQTATISKDGRIVIESYGYNGSTIDYSGKYANKIKNSDGTGYLFKDGKVYALVDRV